VTEIIVADGGSRDNTSDKAREGGALVLQAPKGRGSQIKRGIEASRGDLIWVLHADCVPKPGAAERILATLNERREMVGGALGMEFSGPGWKSGLIARLNNARARWAAIAFGDQGQFFRREVLPEMGGFPNMMLMEDVELSMRLKECGPVCFLPRGVVVSGRRWERKGFTGNTLRVLRLCAAYLVARRLGTASGRDRRFYELYYSASCEAESTSPDDGSRTPAGVDNHNPQSGGDSFKEGRLIRPRLR
jgi:glycosyltransferase involved in cell wall biosynthesis